MSGEDSSSHTTQEIGRTLERARRERGLSLEDVEQATKIRVRYLRDLENENFDVLPAVYMLGSLKTYARYLGLDEGALTREFKNRQALLQEKENPSQEESQSGETYGLFAALGRLLGVGGFERDEDEAGTLPDPGHSPRLYLSLGVVMIFVFIVALASNLRAEDQPSVSQVHETKISKFPSMIALSDTLGDERNTDDEKRDDQPGNGTKSSAKDADKGEKDESERNENNAPLTARASARASSATASASVDASATSSGSASAVAMAQAGSKSERATAGESEDADRGAAADASAGPSAHAHAGPVIRRKQAGPPDAIRLGNRISSKVRVAVHSVQ